MSPDAKLTQGSPTGTTCLIGKLSLIGKLPSNLSPHKRSPASSRSRWGTKTSQMGVTYPATPKIYNFLPEIPHNAPNSEHNHPPATSGNVYLCLLVSPAPTQQPALLYTPALLSGTLGISTTLPAYPQDHICKPDLFRQNGKTLFFWLVGNYRCGCIK